MITGRELLNEVLGELGPVWKDRVSKELAANVADATLCPDLDNIFRAFHALGERSIEAVILGQDPYHARGKASGVAFGYREGYDGPLDSSLLNIFKEVKRDTGMAPTDRTLLSWASQGVLLLNTRLTTVVDRPLAHAHVGWEDFTRLALLLLNQDRYPKSFLLWGAEAKAYADILDNPKHQVLTTSHPCRYSVTRGFEGCGHFGLVNKHRATYKLSPIQWGIAGGDNHGE